MVHHAQCCQNLLYTSIEAVGDLAGVEVQYSITLSSKPGIPYRVSFQPVGGEMMFTIHLNDQFVFVDNEIDNEAFNRRLFPHVDAVQTAKIA